MSLPISINKNILLRVDLNDNEIYEDAIKSTDSFNIFSASMYFNSIDYKKSIELLFKAVELNNPHAIYFLSSVYYYGNYGIQINYEKAKELLFKAVELENIDAINYLAYMYRNGNKIIEKNCEKAVKLYEKAIDIDDFNFDAMHNLVSMYYFGEGIPVNYKKAMIISKKLANLGDDTAMFNLGCMYRLGQGVLIDYKIAKEWYERAAELGNIYAINNLELMLELSSAEN